MSLHNPHNLPHPGNGYRFLNQDELAIRRFPSSGPGADIQFWGFIGEGWNDNGNGEYSKATFRTRLTPAQLDEKYPRIY